eukprot:TRINITY_DN38038_c0_g1_i1.p1 TRINITY_DN38038_c0_g1~~TRINITY_DN38038_c0_g1_i1.p1  ORF type:complete len:235 (-),score=45.92 TRINITY_DN38038_c0_g1_i1:229-933(-)
MAEISIITCGGEPVHLDPAPELDDTVAAVKLQVASQLRCPVSDLVLYHDGQILEENAPMRQYESISILALIADNLQDKIQQVLVDSGAVLGAAVVSRESASIVAAAGMSVLASEAYAKSLLQEDGVTTAEVSIDEVAGLLELVATGRKPQQGIWLDKKKYLLCSHERHFQIGSDVELVSVVLKTLGTSARDGLVGLIMSTDRTVFMAISGADDQGGNSRAALGAFAADRQRRGD